MTEALEETPEIIQQIDDWRRRDMISRKFKERTREEMVETWGEEAALAWEQYEEKRAENRRRMEAEREAEEKLRQMHKDRTERASRLREAQIPTRYQKSTFDALERGRQPAAYDLCRHYSQKGESPDGHPCLLLTGPPGTGKTSLACACLLRLIYEPEQPRYVRFANLSRYLQRLRDRTTRGSEESVLDLASGWTMLVIDDLGRQRLTEWGQEQLYALLDTLYSEGRRVIFTSNVSSAQLNSFLDEALASRLDQMCHREVLAGDDLRKSVDRHVDQGELQLADAMTWDAYS